MNITIFSLFPDFIQHYCSTSIAGRACNEGHVNIEVVNIRNYTSNSYNSCDDAPYGGGAGMVLMAEPIAKALDHMSMRSVRTIFATPCGRPFNQHLAQELSTEENLAFICGHYEGLDERIIELYVDDELSLGDFVVSSGELATLIIVDAVMRLVEGVINPESLVEESFSDGLLEYPQYTRPAEFRNLTVPEVLLSGHHDMIRLWRQKQRLERTRLRRPDLYERYQEGLLDKLSEKE